MTKCYIVEINSCIESMFDDLFDADIHDYKYHVIDDDHIEITFYNIINIIELEEIMKWYI